MTSTIKKPAEQGFRMPAEWELHEATWLAWPHDLETWPKHLADVEATYVDMIEPLHQGEKVHILVDDLPTEEHVWARLRERGITKNVTIHQIETDSIWIRDYGPVFIKRQKELAMIHWGFNAWGGKYPKFKSDSEVPSQISKIIKTPQFKVNMILEGGSIDVNGNGLLLTTEECLLNPNRNPSLNRAQIETFLKDYLGIQSIIWLGKGLAGDDTDGHIDEVARFVSPSQIVIGCEEHVSSAHYEMLKENWKRLETVRDLSGKALEIIPLPMPEKIEHSRTILPASYTNFYIGNTCVLVPIFSDKNDHKALSILKNLFPGRTVIGIPAVPLIYGQGAIHCMTQQEPAHAA